MTKYDFNVTGQDRKLLVTAISGILEKKPRYTGVAKCSHIIGPVTVTRNGCVEVNGTDDEARSLITKLAEMGFTAEGDPHLMRNEQTGTNTAGDDTASPVNEDEDASSAQARNSAATTISVPRSLFSDLAVDNLKKVLRAKGPLLCRALGIDDVEIEVTDQAINFPWFGELTTDEARIFSQLIEKLCKFAIISKRITSKEKRVDNERFTMRTWLIRLGCSGEEYKDLRKRMLANLTGDAAWRFGRPDREMAGI